MHYLQSAPSEFPWQNNLSHVDSRIQTGGIQICIGYTHRPTFIMTMQKHLSHLIILIITVCLASSCKKAVVRHANRPSAGSGPGAQVLVDASKDGGAWWAPQAAPFDAAKPHRGTALVNYIKRLGYSVKELEGSTTITKELLQQYKFVIRAGGDAGYSPSEMEAYRVFLKSNTTLLLITVPQQNSPTDQLSIFLGLQFQGSYTGTITSFNGHSITAGVSSLDYTSGSVILKPDSTVITSLAYFSNASIQNATAMGILNYPGCRIVFLGDLNGISLLPQPLTDNLMRWLL